MRKVSVTCSVSLILVLVAGIFSVTHAITSFMTSFNSRYPNSSLAGKCKVCHISVATPPTPSPRNSYGLDWNNNNRSFAAIEPRDSDADGFTNIVEITAGTFPGDSSSKPVPSAGTVQFTASSYGIAENGGTITITVTRANGSAGAITVFYATSDGTAIAGSDYVPTSGVLSWGAGEVGSKTFAITIINDAIVEGNDTIKLSLSNPTGGAALGSPSTAVLTITNDDGTVSPAIEVNTLPDGPVTVDFAGHEYYTAHQGIHGNQTASSVTIGDPVYVGPGKPGVGDNAWVFKDGNTFVDGGFRYVETTTGNKWSIFLTAQDANPHTASIYIEVGHWGGAGDYLLTAGSTTTTISKSGTPHVTRYQVDVTFVGSVTIEMKPKQTLAWSAFALAAVVIDEELLEAPIIDVTELAGSNITVDFAGGEYYTAHQGIHGNQTASSVTIGDPVYVGPGKPGVGDNAWVFKDGNTFVDGGFRYVETTTGNKWSIFLSGDNTKPQTVSIYMEIGHWGGAGDYLLTAGSTTATISKSGTPHVTRYQVDVTFVGSVTIEMKPKQTLAWSAFALAAILVQ